MTQDIRNPAKLPPVLFPAEARFIRCMGEGAPCKVGDGKLPEERIESGDNANVIRGEVVRFFAYGGNEEYPVLGPSIDLQGAHIDGTLDLSHARISYVLDFSRCHFADLVKMLGTECAALYLIGARLAKGLAADGLTTKGGVDLRMGFSATGAMRLLGASIGGNLDCSNGKFDGMEGVALDADGVDVKGSVFLRNRFSAQGAVRLLGANIGGDLDCSFGRFWRGESRIGQSRNLNGDALSAERANIHGSFFWQHISGRGGVVNLAYANTAVLSDEIHSWEPFKVVLSGFTYDKFNEFADVNSRIKWLANRPGYLQFSSLPYEQAAKTLFEMGYGDDAREILLAKERELTKQAEWWKKPFRWLWFILAGYGYRLRHTLAWMLGFVLLGAAIFGFAGERGQIVPHQPAVVASGEYQAALKTSTPMQAARLAFPDEYPEFSPLAFSLDVFIPVFALHQEPFGPRRPPKKAIY